MYIPEMRKLKLFIGKKWRINITRLLDDSMHIVISNKFYNVIHIQSEKNISHRLGNVIMGFKYNHIIIKLHEYMIGISLYSGVNAYELHSKYNPFNVTQINSKKFLIDDNAKKLFDYLIKHVKNSRKILLNLFK